MAYKLEADQEAAPDGEYRDFWPFSRRIPLDLAVLSHVLAEKCRDQHRLASLQCQKDGEMPECCVIGLRIRPGSLVGLEISSSIGGEFKVPRTAD